MTKQKVNIEIKALTEKINKKFGEGAIFRGGNVKISTIPTGILSLDSLFNYNAPKRGSIIEIYGRELSGKTTLCLIITSHVQKNGGTVAYFDREQKMDLSWAVNFDIDINNLLISHLSTSEDAYQAILDVAKSGTVDLIIMDSLVAGLPKTNEKKEDMDIIVGTAAKFNNMFFSRWCAVMNHLEQRIRNGEKLSKPLLIFTNQIREKIIIMGDPETRSGGRGKDHVTCTRIKLKQKGFIDINGTLLGGLNRNHKLNSQGLRIEGFIEKQQSGLPYKNFEFQFFNKGGFDNIYDKIQYLLSTDQILLSGPYYSSEELFGEQKYKGQFELRKAIAKLDITL